MPSAPQARSLDKYLTARGAIQNLVAELRSRPDRPGLRLVPVPVPSPSAPTLLQTFQNVARALRGCLARDADGRPTGWAPDLRVLPGEATAASTAYGIKTMLLLEDGLAADLVPVTESLGKMARPHGGFAGHEQSEPRPESTAAVLNALRRIAATNDFGAHMAQMERALGRLREVPAVHPHHDAGGQPADRAGHEPRGDSGRQPAGRAPAIRGSPAVAGKDRGPAH